MNKTSTQNLRQINREKVKKALLQHGESNKNQLSQYTFLSVASITNILKDLIEAGEVMMGEGFASTGGRCAKSYKLNGNAIQFLAISFIRQYHHVWYIRRVYNQANELLQEIKTEATIIETNQLIKDIEKVMIEFPKIKMIVISIPAILSSNGKIDNLSMKGFKDGYIKEELEKNFKCKVMIENDVNVAAIGYYYQNPQFDYYALLYQPKDELVGVSYIYKGQLIRGVHNLAGELAYLPFIDQDRQYGMLENKKSYYDLIAQLIITVVVTFDPGKIIVSGEDLDLYQLQRELKKHLPDNLLPEIILIDNMTQYIFSGLLVMAQEAVSSNLIMTTQTIYE